MIKFPIFNKLEVNHFGLYPDKQGNPGLSVHFKAGLTLILGANGLGKTTLITILYRLLTGPYDIPSLTARRSNLGSAKLKPTALNPTAKRVFARCVTDGAKNANACLSLTIGNTEVVIERRLRDLALTKLLIDNKHMELDETAVYQPHVTNLVGVWSFGDWILLLRHMVFYFEDRRALVWDPSAQRQLLRLLLLPAPIARQWTEDERTILELDSRMRNLTSIANREENTLTVAENQVQCSDNVRKELQTLQQLQATDVDQREKLDQSLLYLDEERKNAQLHYLKLQQERESRYREFERAKLIAVESRFPQNSDSARYILGHLFAEQDCLVCGNHAPEAATLLENRINQNLCVICGAGLVEPVAEVDMSAADRRVKKSSKTLEMIGPSLSDASRKREESRAEFENCRTKLMELDVQIAKRTARIDELVRCLPPSEQKIHDQRSELALLRRRIEELSAELTNKRDVFSAFVDTQNQAMVSQSDKIREKFADIASDFLLEIVNLVWAPQSARVGQTGETIRFPAFELDMTGTNFPTPVRRTGPDHVSESQREFIDLAFRMSLMEVVSEEACSLVIDAPESSLDAVFATRAANVLSNFAGSNRNNRLIITSNLVEGGLIPKLLKQPIQPDDGIARVVDLFKIAEPTAAIRELGDEYDVIMQKLMAELDQSNATADSHGETGLLSENARSSD